MCKVAYATNLVQIYATFILLTSFVIYLFIFYGEN
jgi:hypothetical protein